jgi:hypothetical protein
VDHLGFGRHFDPTWTRRIIDNSASGGDVDSFADARGWLRVHRWGAAGGDLVWPSEHSRFAAWTFRRRADEFESGYAYSLLVRTAESRVGVYRFPQVTRRDRCLDVFAIQHWRTQDATLILPNQEQASIRDVPDGEFPMAWTGPYNSRRNGELHELFRAPEPEPVPLRSRFEPRDQSDPWIRVDPAPWPPAERPRSTPTLTTGRRASSAIDTTDFIQAH